jgi:membrane-associated protease RseP (regulator of RpoE activity)
MKELSFVYAVHCGRKVREMGLGMGLKLFFGEVVL